MNRKGYDKNNNYNKLVSKLSQWDLYRNKLELDAQIEFSPVNVSVIVKKLACEKEAIRLLKTINIKDMNFYDSCYPLVDDFVLISYFKNTVKVSD